MNLKGFGREVDCDVGRLPVEGGQVRMEGCEVWERARQTIQGREYLLVY
jgi:hypothetical protein